MKKSITIWWFTLGFGVLLMCGSLVGVAGTIFQMQEVMLEIEQGGGELEQVSQTASDVSEGMSDSLISTFIGMGVGSLGLIVVVAAIIGLVVCYTKAKRPGEVSND